MQAWHLLQKGSGVRTISGLIQNQVLEIAQEWTKKYTYLMSTFQILTLSAAPLRVLGLGGQMQGYTIWF